MKIKSLLLMSWLFLFLFLFGCGQINQQEVDLSNAILSPKGLLVSAEFEKNDFNFSEPVQFTVTVHNPTTLTVSEVITIEFAGFHVPMPLAAVAALPESVASFPIMLDLDSNESVTHKFEVEMDIYKRIGTGSYHLFFVEIEESLDHARISGALEIEVFAPNIIEKDQELHFDVEIHNSTKNTVYDISVYELHRYLDEFIPNLVPGQTVEFSGKVPIGKYQNTNSIGISILTETPNDGSDLESKSIEINGYFDE